MSEIIKNCCELKKLVANHILKKTVSSKEPETYFAVFSGMDFLHQIIKKEICENCEKFYKVAEDKRSGFIKDLRGLAEHYSEVAIKG